jgi:uncharacterized protein YecT (DUF1311 family)
MALNHWRTTPEYKPIETELNTVYSRLRSTLSEKAKLVLKNEQLDWLAKREKFKNNPDAFIASTKREFVSYHSAIVI